MEQLKSPLNKKSLHSVIEHAMESGGRRIAVEQGECRVDYETLNRQANRLAWLLKSLGIAPGGVVGLPMPASIEYAASLVATVKAGAIFIPLDPAYPDERLRQVLAVARPKVLVVRQADLATGLRVAKCATDPIALVRLDADGEARVVDGKTAPVSSVNPPIVADDDDTGYLIHTSGSTGVPKLIAGRNKGVSHFIHWEVAELGLDDNVRASFLAPPTFDVSLREILVPLLAGGSLIIPEADDRADADRLVAWLRRRRVSLMHLVPSLFRLLSRALRERTEAGGLPDLKIVALAGEPLYGADVAAWRAVAGNASALINLYGPSETTLAKAFHRVDSETYAAGAIVPIGRPIANTAILILKDGGLAEIGEIGEIHIRTPFASNGYFADPQRTAESFIANPLANDSADLIYRTGDLGRYRADRSVEFVGRADRQVKVDGVRVELPEIEGAMRGHASVTEAAVQAFRLADGGNRLVGYYTGDLDPSPLRIYLAGKLPAAMIPGHLVRLDDFPRNLNGKIDRKALPRPEALIESDHAYEAPANAVETAIALLWGEALGLGRVGVNSPYLQVGGNSLRAIGLIGRINRQFGVNLTLRDFFENGTIRAIARRVSEAKATDAPQMPIPLAPEREDYPLTDGQRRLWILTRIEEGQTLYNNVEWLEFSGSLDLPALQRAFQNLVDRHESLRTAFLAGADGEPRQRILPPWTVGLHATDLRESDPLPTLLARELATPFDLEAGQPLRLHLYREAPDCHHLLLTMHHIACDGWSMGILVRELSEGYRAAREGRSLELPDPERRMRDVAEWIASSATRQVQESHAAFWRTRLVDADQRALLPGDAPLSAAVTSRHWEAGRLRVSLSRQAELRGLLAERQATPFMAVAAAVSILLYRYGGKESVLIGTPVSGRGRPELANTVGFLVNTLPLTLRLSPELSPIQLLERVRRAIGEIHEHQDFAFEHLLAEYGDPGTPLRHPLFDVFLAMEPAATDPGLPDVKLVEHEIPQPVARYDLTLRLADEGSRLHLILEYRRSLFAATTMERFCRHLGQLLDGFANHADRPLCNLRMLDDAELATLTSFASGPQRPQADQTLHGLFAAVAERRPDATALITRQGETSYRSLEDRAHVLAAVLAERVAPRDVVAVLLPPTPDWPATMLAIMMVGGIYLPLDARHPPARLRELLTDSAARVLVTESNLIPALSDMTMQTLDPAAVSADQIRPSGQLPAVSPDDPAYLIYTSGSSGTPKGVLVSHRAFANMILDLIPALDAAPSDRILQFASPAFDVSLFEVFLALHSGATLVLTSREDCAAAEVFAQTIRDFGITVAMMTPGFLHSLGDSPLPSLRLLVTGGEAPNRDDADRRLAAGIRYVNAYGPTEAAVNAAFQELARESVTAAIALGRPVANTSLEVLAPDLTPVPLGIPGELVIGGAGLACGYLNRPALTERNFVNDRLGRRLYRTGDRAKRCPDGSLVFLGRVDEQVKIRGHRVELGEIENTLRQLPGITDARVITRPMGDDLELAAYWTGSPLDPADVLAALAGRLPEYELPRFCAHLVAFPLTINGKLDVKRLPEPARIRVADEPPRPGVETLLAGLWGEVLALPVPGRHGDFFALGGRSLAANRLALKAAGALGRMVSLRDIYVAPTPAALAERLGSATPTPAEPIRCLTPDIPAPLSPMQRRLWAIDRLGDAGAAYHIAGLTQLCGRLNPEALQLAFEDVVTRHQVLRSRIVVAAAGEPRQVVDLHGSMPWRSVAAGDWNAARFDADIEFETHRPFNLCADWPIRVSLYAVGDDDWRLLVVLHHIAADGWSMPILEQELAIAYNARREGNAPGWAALPLQYRDVAGWLEQKLAAGRFGADADYWRQRLAGALPILDLPTDRPRPAVRRFQGDTRRYPFPDGLAEKIISASTVLAATPFAFLLAGVQILLHRLSRQDDMIVGVPVAGRQHPASAPLIGFFVNTLPLRDSIDGEGSFAHRVACAATVLKEALGHQEYPFDRLVRDLDLERDTSRSPVFDVMVSFDDSAGAAPALTGLSAAALPLARSGCRCDLAWMFDFTGQGQAKPALVLEYDTDLFTPQRMDDWVARLFLLLESGLRAPQTTVDDLAWLQGGEKYRLLEALNRTVAPYPRQSVVQLFESQARRRANDLALVTDDERWSYDKLNRMANRLAHAILAEHGAAIAANAGETAAPPVAILAERGIPMVVALLAVLKCGAAFLPLEPDAPAARLESLLADSRARLLLRDPALATPPLPEGVALMKLAVPASGPEDNPPARASLSDPIYVMYTSGSTGLPKGVVVHHAAVVRLVQGTDYYIPATGDRLLQLSNYAFDGATFDFWAALTHGLPLAIPHRDAVLDVRRLAGFIRHHRVNVTFVTTALFNRLVDEDPATLGCFRRLYFGGQEASLPHVRRALAAMTGGALVHVYGPTETTTFATWHPVTAADVGPEAVRLPIGRPIANTRAYVLDGRRQPLPPDVPGELYLGGDGVALGYLGQPELTAERFLPSPFQEGDRLYRTGDLCSQRQDGTIDFLGRLDEQVKVRGYRIELGEIEQRLLSHPAVGKVHVMPRRNAAANLELVAYLTAASEQYPPRRAELCAHLERWLPHYMIPARFVLLSALPLNLNGKVDRGSLPPPEDGCLVDVVANTVPASAAQRALWQAWRDVLGTESFGFHDNYFSLGGDSIQAIQIAARLREAGFTLKVTDLLRTPTIEALAPKLEHGPAALPAASEAIAASGEAPLTPIQHWFLDQEFETPSHFNQSILLHLPFAADGETVRATIAFLQQHHDALRLSFGVDPRDPRGPWQCVLPTQEVSVLEAFPDSARAMMKMIERLQRSISPATGPLLKAALFQLADGPRLFLTIHHWAVDGVSWRILLKDLAAALVQAGRRETIALPPRTTPFRARALSLAAAAHDLRFTSQRDYWLEQAVADAGHLPRLRDSGLPAVVGKRMVLDFSLSSSLTEALLGSAHAAYRTTSDDLLLAAWVRTLIRFQRHPTCRITMEAHGREALSGDEDLSGTVGWFTALYPLRVTLSNDDWPTGIREVKEARRRVPDGGIGYGILRYLSKDPGLIAAIPPEIGFNYLGRFDRDLPIPLAVEGTGDEIAATTRLPHSLDVTAEVREGRLRVRLVGDGTRHPESCFVDLARHFEQALHEIGDHCMHPDSGALSPSDVDLEGLDVAGLDALLSGLGTPDIRV